MRLGKTLALGIFGLCAGALLAMPQSPRVTSQLVIQDVTVIDAASGTSRAHMTIAISDRKIERMEKYSGGSDARANPARDDKRASSCHAWARKIRDFGALGHAHARRGSERAT